MLLYQEFTFVFNRKEMKKHLIALFLSFICLTATAQKVTIAIHQDYLVPDIPQITQNSDTLRSSSPIVNQWLKDGMELPGENNQNLVVASSGNYNSYIQLLL